MKRPVDRRQVETLAQQLHSRVIRPHLSGPQHPNRVLELLNAIAFTLAPLFGGTGFEPATFEFFRTALTDNLRAMAATGTLKRGPAVPPWLEAAAQRDRVIEAAETLVGEIMLQGTHTSWKRLAEALAAAATPQGHG
jgi:hypothetical protein